MVLLRLIRSRTLGESYVCLYFSWFQTDLNSSSWDFRLVIMETGMALMKHNTLKQYTQTASLSQNDLNSSLKWSHLKKVHSGLSNYLVTSASLLRRTKGKIFLPLSTPPITSSHLTSSSWVPIVWKALGLKWWSKQSLLLSFNMEPSIVG